MTNDLQDRWQAIRAKERELGGDQYITSLETISGGRAGVVNVVTSYVAAMRIVEGTHRLAMFDERTAYDADMTERTSAAVIAQQRTAGKSVVLGSGRSK